MVYLQDIASGTGHWLCGCIAFSGLKMVYHLSHIAMAKWAAILVFAAFGGMLRCPLPTGEYMCLVSGESQPEFFWLCPLFFFSLSYIYIWGPR